MFSGVALPRYQRENAFGISYTLRTAPQSFDLVITDQTMPQMTGAVLARELLRFRPDIPVILCTGFSHVLDAAQAQKIGIDAFLMKPVILRDLAVTIRQVLTQRRSA